MDLISAWSRYGSRSSSSGPDNTHPPGLVGLFDWNLVEEIFGTGTVTGAPRYRGRPGGTIIA